MDNRPVVKQDLDDLKSLIDEGFKAQAEARARMYQKLEEAGHNDVAHDLKIRHLEARMGRFFAGITTLFIGFILALVKFAFDMIKGS